MGVSSKISFNSVLPCHARTFKYNRKKYYHSYRHAVENALFLDVSGRVECYKDSRYFHAYICVGIV